MTSCFVYRNFRERRRVSVDVQDGGTHKPGSHAVGVDTGGGLTDSGEKTSSSKSASKSGGGIFGLTFRSRRKSEAARFKSDVRGEVSLTLTLNPFYPRMCN